MSTPHILLTGTRVSLAMTDRDHRPDYHRWENDPATILGWHPGRAVLGRA